MPPPQATRCPVLYDADGLLIVDKPAGLLSHPNPSQSGAAQGRAAFEGAYDFEERCFKTPEGPVWLIHRLDQDTSGILVAARDRAAAGLARKLFEQSKVLKIYRALVMGEPRPRQGKWRDHLIVQKKSGQVRSRILPGRAPNADLRYETERYFPKDRLALLRIELVTGMTHQIRVQAAHRGHPLVGDEIYGHFAFNRKLRKTFGFKRLFLHASEFQLAGDPPLHVGSPLPGALQDILERLTQP